MYEEIKEKFKKLEEQLQDPAILSNQEKYVAIAQEYKELKGLVEKINRFENLMNELKNVDAMLEEEQDEEMKEFLKEEKARIEAELEKLDREIKFSLVPQDPEDAKNAIMEIRAGTGGEEAALFARDLFRMYTKYAEKKGWKVSVTDLHETPLGGYKEVIFMIEGRGVYGRLKYESGVHRVQRIPVTETGGRIHTSSASVVVLPEAEEQEIEISPDELKIETFRASGPGGQHVNVTDSAVRITHLPTGIVVACQDERSQHKNRAKALRILRARLQDLYRKEREKEIGSKRKSYIGTGDRSEKIRTYNFPQNRVTDHRINLTIYNLEGILDGDLDEILDKLHEVELEKKLKELSTA